MVCTTSLPYAFTSGLSVTCLADSICHHACPSNQGNPSLTPSVLANAALLAQISDRKSTALGQQDKSSYLFH
jgi:hypothetical protein